MYRYNHQNIKIFWKYFLIDMEHPLYMIILKHEMKIITERVTVINDDGIIMMTDKI